MLCGRVEERARIERLLEDAAQARSGALLLAGEPGIGKTALLEHAVARSDGMTVVTATGVESEQELRFSGLLELARPLLGRLDDLPESQREALAGALGLGAATGGDRFAVGAATLSLLAAAAEERPVLVVVDDVQWLDRASREAILFAVRRLYADRVAFLFAARDDLSPAEVPGVEVLALTGLGRDESSELLRRATGRALAPDLVERLHAAAGGNPLALVELPAVVDVDELPALEAGEVPLPAGERVRRAFAGRAELLPEPTRRALVLLSVSTSPSSDVVRRALAEQGLAVDALVAAEDAGLVELSDTIRFRHPLVRSAVHDGASPSERRAAHRALAVALDAVGDPERRAWHLASAALEPDEEVAASLAAAAEHARERRGIAAAAAALERSARLTPDPAKRRERLLAAAEASWFAGAVERSSAMLAEILETCHEPEERSRVLHLLGRIERQRGTQAVSRALLLEAADLVEAIRPATAATILVDAAIATFASGDVAAAVDAAARARSLAERDGSQADGYAEYMVGRMRAFAGDVDAARPALERAVSMLLEADDVPRISIAAAAIALEMLERVDESRALASRSTGMGREEGPLGLAAALALETYTEVRFGDWRRAAACGTEGVKLARDLGSSGLLAHFLLSLARLEAARGDDAACRALLAEADGLAAAAGNVVQRLEADSVRGLLDLGLGRLGDAVEPLERVAAEVASLGLHDRDAAPEPDLVEALVGLDRLDEAHAVLAAWDVRGPRCSPRWGKGLAERCHGLLAPDDAFAACFEAALEQLASVGDGFAVARTSLCYGERLRRAGRKTEARTRLRDAVEAFERLEARAWAERARRELRASGEKLRRARSSAGDELTPQELQVALQVADGKTNKEVGAALFLSPKTVEFHLGRVYRKLDVSSRAELVRRFASELAPVA